MIEIKAFEHNGQLFRTKEEAIKQELYEGLRTLFLNCSWHEIMFEMVNRKGIQNEVVNLITKYQEASNDRDGA